MALLSIAKLGNPVLRKTAAPVESGDLKGGVYQRLIDDMFETMYEANGIGLAAPQVAKSVQLIVMACPGEGGFPETVLVNPRIVFYGPQQAEHWEGCLSVDGLRGKVTRPSTVRVQALDRQGRPVDFEASGLYAVCIQHEMDHLHGRVFVEHLSDLKQNRIRAKLKKRQRKAA